MINARDQREYVENGAKIVHSTVTGLSTAPVRPLATHQVGIKECEIFHRYDARYRQHARKNLQSLE